MLLSGIPGALVAVPEEARCSALRPPRPRACSKARVRIGTTGGDLLAAAGVDPLWQRGAADKSPDLAGLRERSEAVLVGPVLSGWSRAQEEVSAVSGSRVHVRRMPRIASKPQAGGGVHRRAITCLWFLAGEGE